MAAGYMPGLGAALRHGPWVAAAAALAVTPVGFAVIAAALEHRLFDGRREFVALTFGDPLLAISVALGVWLLHGRVPGGAAGLPSGLAWLVLALGFGLWQWRAELRSGFYTRAGAGADEDMASACRVPGTRLLGLDGGPGLAADHGSGRGEGRDRRLCCGLAPSQRLRPPAPQTRPSAVRLAQAAPAPAALAGAVRLAARLPEAAYLRRPI
jgi:hypothetical protein